MFVVLEILDDGERSMTSGMDLSTVPSWAVNAGIYGLRGLYDALKEVFEKTYKTKAASVILYLQEDGDPDPIARYSVSTVEKQHNEKWDSILDKSLVKAIQPGGGS